VSRAGWKAPACLGAVALVIGCQLDKLLSTPGQIPVPPGPPARLVFSPLPPTARAGHPISPGVQVSLQDSAGHLTGGDSAITVQLRENPGNARLEGDTTARALNGVATFANLRLKKAAKGYTLAARYAGLPLATSRTFSVAPDAPTAITFTVQPSGALADSVIAPPVELTAFDSFDNQASDFSGMVRVALGRDGSAHKNAKLTGKTAAPAVAGVATFATLHVDQAGEGYTLTAALGTAGGAPVTESAQFDVTDPPPRATHLEVVTPPPAGPLRLSPFQVQVAAVDDERRIVNGFAGRVTIVIAHDGSATRNARLGGATEAALVNGIATFSDLTIDQAGVGYTLRANTPGLASATSDAFNVVL
jgi:hypothetical protein